MKTDRNKLQELIKFALPAIIESILVAFLVQADTYLVSGQGTEAVASVALTVQPIKFLMVIFTGICTAITKYVAEAVGRQDRPGANAIARNGLLLTLGLSLLICLFGCIFADGIIRLCGSNADTHVDATAYFRIVLLGFIPENLSLYINAVKRGCQNSRVSMLSNVAGNITNVLFDIVLINGLLGFPALGVRGAAIATDIGYTVAFLFSLAALRKGKDIVTWGGMRQRSNTCDPAVLKGFLTLSGTLLLELSFTKLGFLLVSVMTAKIGTTELAVDRVAMNLLDIVFSFGTGLQAAALTMIGRSLGRGNKKEAVEYADTSLFLGMLVAAALGLVFWLAGPSMILLFFKGGEVFTEYAEFVSRISAFIVLVQMPQLILNGILRGAGMGKDTLHIGIFSILFFLVLLDYILIFKCNLGLHGKWIGSLAGQAMWCFLLTWKYIQWKKDQ